MLLTYERSCRYITSPNAGFEVIGQSGTGVTAYDVKDAVHNTTRYFTNSGWESGAVLPTAHSGAGPLHVAKCLRYDGRATG